MIKPGARVEGLKPEIVLAYIEAMDLFRQFGYPCVLTEGTGGGHKLGSLHLQGLAIDLRTKHIGTRVTKAQLMSRLRDNLGVNYDVLLEYEGGDNEHIHIEYDPKG